MNNRNGRSPSRRSPPRSPSRNLGYNRDHEEFQGYEGYHRGHGRQGYSYRRNYNGGNIGAGAGFLLGATTGALLGASGQAAYNPYYAPYPYYAQNPYYPRYY